MMTRDEIMAVESVMDRIWRATSSYRRSEGLSGIAPVPDWMSDLEASQGDLSRLVESAQDEILKRAPKEPIPCAD